MSTKKSKEYIAIKNFLHNECGLTKEEIIAIATAAIRDEAKAETRKMFQHNNGVLKNEIQNVISRELNSTTYGNLRGEIVRKTSELIAQKLKFSIS